MNTARRSATLALATAFLAAGCATGSDQASNDGGEEVEAEDPEVRTQRRTVAFAEWDGDGDAALDRGEFVSWWEEEGMPDAWDGDAADGISEEEFTSGLYDHWDRDDDDRITEREWEERVVVWFADTDYGIWSEWDLDGDSTLDLDEVREGLARESLYDTVDLDDDYVLSRQESTAWVFDTFDTNDDGQIDISEWIYLGI